MMRRIPRELALWVPVALIPIVSGAVRLLAYARWIGEPRASIVSSALDVIAMGAYACLVQRRWPAESAGRAVGRGLLWVTLTTLDHFALGLFVFSLPLSVVVGKYDLFAGETWLLVSLGIFAAPPFAWWRSARNRSGHGGDAIAT